MCIRDSYCDDQFKNVCHEDVEPDVNLDWYTGYESFVSGPKFSIRWEGKLTPSETEMCIRDSESPAPGKDDGGASGNSSGGSGTSAPAPAGDPDKPTLHKKEPTDSTASGAPPDNPDRPVLKKSKKRPAEDVGHVDSLPDVTDPDRPRLCLLYTSRCV